MKWKRRLIFRIWKFEFSFSYNRSLKQVIFWTGRRLDLDLKDKVSFVLFKIK